MSVHFRYRFLVLWQSLVVASYRSFFAHLMRLTDAPVTLVAPDAFRELGGQMTPCAPFEAPFDRTGPGRAHILHCFSPHVQIVFFKGLRKILREFFNSRSDQSAARPVFLCIAEPYSITAFAAWLLARCSHRRPEFVFITYSAQNIFKKLALPLAMIQRFLFTRSHAILVCGHGQEPVLRKHGYTGPVIYFPLWFDSSRFYPVPTGEAERKLAPVLSFPPPDLSGKRIIRFGYCGSLSEEKGVHDLLQLFSTGNLPSHMVLFVAGDGPLKEQVAQAGGALHYAGRLTPDQTSAFMNVIDILIVPSRTTPHWKEQFGRVIVEAMACGVVVLGSDSGEIPYVIGDAARIFHEGDQAGLKDLVLRWAEHVSGPGLHDEKEKSRARAEAFTDIRCAERFRDQLASLEIYPKTPPSA